MENDYEIKEITHNIGGMVHVSPKWTWVYADFDGEPRWLMTPDIKPLNCPDLLFVIDGDGLHLYASTYSNTPVELWAKWGQEHILEGSAAAVERAFPQIAAEYRESLSTIQKWMARDPRFPKDSNP